MEQSTDNDDNDRRQRQTIHDTIQSFQHPPNEPKMECEDLHRWQMLRLRGRYFHLSTWKKTQWRGMRFHGLNSNGTNDTYIYVDDFMLIS